MTWLIEYQMERRLAANKKLLYLLLMSYGFYYSKADDQIRNLNCYNDYETKMVCTWEVTKLETNCATEYRMIYERAIVSLPTNTCIPENVKVDDYILPNNCYCNISVSFFAAGDEYYIEIQSDGKVLINDTILPYETIKPKTPENLTVEFNENDDAILRWAESTSLDIRDHLNFRIHYYSKQDPANTYSVLREIPATQFEISSSQLKLGYDYVARIQSKVSRGYDGTWSDWSNEIEWPNDRKNYSVELIVPLSCILMIVLIVMCYIWICMGLQMLQHQQSCGGLCMMYCTEGDYLADFPREDEGLFRMEQIPDPDFIFILYWTCGAQVLPILGASQEQFGLFGLSFSQ